MNDLSNAPAVVVIGIAVFATVSVTVALFTIRELACLLFRHLNIRAAGWPPAHCDADGEAVYVDGEEPIA